MSQHVGIHGHRELGLLAVFAQGEVDCRAVQALMGADCPAPAGTHRPSCSRSAARAAFSWRLIAITLMPAHLRCSAATGSPAPAGAGSPPHLGVSAEVVSLQRKLRWLNFRCRLTQGAAAAASCPAGLRSGRGLCAALHHRAASDFSSVP